MFQQLYELSQCLPPREPWKWFNEGMPANYDPGLAVYFNEQGHNIKHSLASLPVSSDKHASGMMT